MSRARFSASLSSAVLSLIALTAAAGFAQADVRGRAAPGAFPIVVPPPKPIAAPTFHARRDRLGGAPAGRIVTEQVWRTEPTIIEVVDPEPRRLPIRMRSGNPIDPGAVLARTPSGRVVIGPPPGVLITAQPALAEARPYAPPEFHMIGASSSRHMGSPVRLTHGIKPPEALRTGPKVVWLNEAGQSADDSGGRIKRLR
jgi:hypothetical protein